MTVHLEGILYWNQQSAIIAALNPWPVHLEKSDCVPHISLVYVRGFQILDSYFTNWILPFFYKLQSKNDISVNGKQCDWC